MRMRILLLAGFWSAASIADTIYTVDSTLDDVDLVPGDGICATAESQCTLRAALQEIYTNAGLTGHVEVRLPPGAYALARTIGDDAVSASAGDLDLYTSAASLSLIGWKGGAPVSALERPVITADALFPRRLMRVTTGVVPDQDVTLQDLVLEGAHATPWGQHPADPGGALQSACSDNGSLTLKRVSLRSNSTTAVGAAWENLGCHALLIDTDITNNCGLGAALYSRATLSGALGSVVISSSSITGNSPDCLNPNLQFHAAHLQTLVGSQSWWVEIQNSTISHNAGGLFIQSPGQASNPPRQATLRNITLHQNEQNSEGLDGLDVSGDIDVYASHSILGDVGGKVIFGARVTSLGHSRYSFNVQVGSSLTTHPTDLAANAPLGLSPLTEMNGYTWAHLPTLASGAIVDTGSPVSNVAPEIGCAPHDQGGAARPQGAACDIGAVESISTMIFKNGFEG